MPTLNILLIGLKKMAMGKKPKKSFFAEVALLLLSLLIFVLAVVYGPSNRIAPEPIDKR